METTRFETFFDAIIAIIITVLVLKIPQPATPTLSGILDLQFMYIAYLISFLVLYNIWYANHNLFQIIDTIDNTSVWIYGIMTFFISLLPYFTIWLARDIYSIPAETMFGLLFISTHILDCRIYIDLHHLCSWNLHLLFDFHHFMDIDWQIA